MSTAPEREQRRFPRAPVELPVKVADTTNAVQGRIQFDIADVSVGGAFVRSDLLFEVGEELELLIALSGGRSVVARARVARVVRDNGDDAAPGMGMQFVDLSDADRQVLVDEVARLAKP